MRSPTVSARRGRNSDVDICIRLCRLVVERAVAEQDNTAHDDRDAIAQGTHERFIIDFERFNANVLEKAKNIRAGGS